MLDSSKASRFAMSSDQAPILRVERRELYRSGVDWPVVIARSTGDLLPCHVVDISQGGMCLRSAHAFAPGSFLRLQLKLPGFGAVSLRSRVCYQVLDTDSIVTGVRFENLGDEVIVLLKKALETIE